MGPPPTHPTSPLPLRSLSLHLLVSYLASPMVSIDLYQPYHFGATRSNASHSRFPRLHLHRLGLLWLTPLHQRVAYLYKAEHRGFVTFGADAMSSDLMSLTNEITGRVSTPEGPTKLHTAHALRAICATGGSDRIAAPGLSCLPPKSCFTCWSWQGDLKGCDITSRTVRVLDASCPRTPWRDRGAVGVAQQWIALGVFYRPLPHRTLPHSSEIYASLDVIEERATVLRCVEAYQ